MQRPRRGSRDKTSVIKVSVKDNTKENREYKSEAREHIAGYNDFKSVAETRFQKRMYENKDNKEFKNGVSLSDMI